MRNEEQKYLKPLAIITAKAVGFSAFLCGFPLVFEAVGLMEHVNLRLNSGPAEAL